MTDGPRVFSSVVSPDCLCRWERGPDDWELVDRSLDCPLHGPGQAFDYWGQA